MIKIKFLIFIVIISCFYCCDKLFPDEKLSLQRIDYKGNELQTNGYYYCYFAQTDVTAIYFLYRNGIIRYIGGYSRYNEDNREQEIIKYYNKSVKTDWGVFVVDANSIQYETWEARPSGVSACIRRRSGYIENDTTFCITESYYSGRNETKQVNEIYHFKQFENKPDSTNIYVK
ncbi:MAG: hypothetical protein LBR10_13185 [Prevotellaceae bacterium]|jgi:hypothetical protein|nr:hypothetical protein [Prevotellaceae bacterium]